MMHEWYEANDEEFRFFLTVSEKTTSYEIGALDETCNKRMKLDISPMDKWTELAFYSVLQKLRRFGVRTDGKPEFMALVSANTYIG